MEDLLNLGHMLSIHARLSPGRTGAGDLDRSISLATSNDCVCRLAGTLLDPSRKNFDQDPCVRTLAESDASFTSLVPTPHIMIQDCPLQFARGIVSTEPRSGTVGCKAESRLGGVRSAIAGCMG